MLKAVFFDWSYTLARYIPSREELQSQALKEFGVEISPENVTPAISEADSYLFEESAVSPITRRSLPEQALFFAHYEQLVLSRVKADIPASSEIFPKLLKSLEELYRQLKFVLYDDVIPAMKTLKQEPLTLALVTNMDADMKAACRELGLAPYLDVILTSSDVGAAKPNPNIFLTALRNAGVKASETVHVGDQPDIDIAGAKGVGVQPVMLDRSNQFPDFKECPRFTNLPEIVNYLLSHVR